MNSKYYFYILFFILISCKEEQLVDETTTIESNPVERTFNRDSISLNELSGSDLTSFSDREEKYIKQLLDQGKLDATIMAYDCPNILDKGQLTIYKENKEVKYILHTFQNGKQKASQHQYYLYDNQLFLTNLRDGYWSFEHGVDKRSRNISTDSKYYFNGLEGLDCTSRKFVYTEQDQVDIEADKIEFDVVPCSKSRVILSKFRLLQSILNNPKRVDKPCIFY